MERENFTFYGIKIKKEMGIMCWKEIGSKRWNSEIVYFTVEKSGCTERFALSWCCWLRTLQQNV